MAWVDALRMRQWHKNLLVFVALVFSFSLDQTAPLWKSILLFCAFCMASSASYLLNDLNDRVADRLHPLKKNRAIAAGHIRPSLALAVSGTFILLSLLVSYLWISSAATWFILAYFGLQIAYNFGLRDIVAADVITIALGFILRAVAGAVAIGVPFSEWLLVCTFFGAVRLALGKRQAELYAARVGLRKGWEEISDAELKILGAMTSAVLLVAYSLYSFTSHTAGLVAGHFVSPLILTLPIVYFGIVRYELLAARGGAGDPELLPISDKPLAIALLGWLAISFASLYLWRMIK